MTLQDELATNIVAFPNSATPEQRAECEIAMSALEQEAEKWAVEVDLPSIANMLAKVSPAGLNNSAPESIRADFLRRQERLIERMIEQAWIEGAYRGAIGAFDAVRAGYDPNTRLRPLPPAGGWRDIKDGAPIGTLALFYDHTAPTVREMAFVDWRVDGRFIANPKRTATHWQPINPPATASDKE